MPRDVLEHDVPRHQRGDSLDKIGPQVTRICRPAPSPCQGERLARIPAAQHVDRLDSSPINGGDVAQVRHARPVRRKDFRRVRVGLAMPHRAATSDMLNGQIEATGAGEE